METRQSGDSKATAPEPTLPRGRYVETRRGSFFVRDVPGPPGAPTLVLIHGWMATGALNWFQVFEPLSRHFRVIAPDLRGHGRGPKTWRRFRLEDCADDVAAIIRKLAAGPVIVAGYSMGGPVSQLLWKRHSPLVAGLIQCATSDKLTRGRVERMTLATITMAVAGTTRIGQLPAVLPRWIARRVMPSEVTESPTSPSDFAIDEMRRHDVRMLMEAGYAISQYDGSHFTRDIHVPAAVVVTLHDTAILERYQMELAHRLPTARTFRVADGHIACREKEFAAPLLEACLDVHARAQPQRVRPALPASQPASWNRRRAAD